MAKKFHMQVEERSIRAGDIRRHPLSQRLSQLKRFRAKVGDYDQDRNQEFIHVVSDGNGKWLAVDGATRVENCLSTKGYGPGHPMQCKVYGNGKVPTVEDTSELFLVFNADRIPVSAVTQFKQAVLARRPDAVEAHKLCKMLGPKFKGPTGMWGLVQEHGTLFARRVVDEVFTIWGADVGIQFSVVKVIAEILAMKNGPAILKRRRTTLRKTLPAGWRIIAQNTMLRAVGKRKNLGSYLREKLLGRGNI